MAYLAEFSDGSLIEIPKTIDRAWQEYAHHLSRERRADTARAKRCNQPILRTSSFSDYARMVRQAEMKLIQCGRASPEDRLHILSGIYYGTPWSRDFDVEKSTARNVAFQAFLARPYTNSDDPRPCLGCGLFESLKRSQDVAGVDMGHTLIGLNARMRTASRSVPFPATSSTGLEITTWVGDLAGGSARLALDRRTGTVAATKYFSGTDYGAPSNLEGDLAGSLVAAGSPSGGVSAPSISSSGFIASAIEDYFVKKIGWANRGRDFLVLQGASFSGSALTNRNRIRSSMADKFEAFGRLYLVNFLRQHSSGPLAIAGATAAAFPLLRRASEEVADIFIGKLLLNRFK